MKNTMRNLCCFCKRDVFKFKLILRGGERTYVERMVHTCSSVAVYIMFIITCTYVSCQDSSINLITIITIYYIYYNTYVFNII